MRRFVVPLSLLILVTAAACAAGDPRFTEADPAGFWVGLWHGAISVITLIVGIFSDTINVYEVQNTGGWYDFGFLFGVTAIWGGGSSTVHHNSRKKARDKEWEELSVKVQDKIQRKLGEWAEAEPDEEWEVVSAKAEAKLKRKIREWADSP